MGTYSLICATPGCNRSADDWTGFCDDCFYRRCVECGITYSIDTCPDCRCCRACCECRARDDDMYGQSYDQCEVEDEETQTD